MLNRNWGEILLLFDALSKTSYSSSHTAVGRKYLCVLSLYFQIYLTQRSVTDNRTVDLRTYNDWPLSSGQHHGCATRVFYILNISSPGN